MEPEPRRGVLFPARLPTYTRVAAPAEVAALVRHFWIPEWDIPPGRVSRQHLLGHPAANLAVEPDTVALAGPTTVRSHRDLTGAGWTVGARLWPAAVPALCTPTGIDPEGTVDAQVEVDAPDLHAAVVAAMEQAGEPEVRHAAAVAAFVAWLRERCGEPGEQALLANEMVRLAETDATARTLADLAGRLAVSASTVEQLARTYVGLSPLALIRRRRLEEAADRLRRVGPEVEDETMATIAAELGYADHAHLARDFGAVLGWTPDGHRDAARTSSLRP